MASIRHALRGQNNQPPQENLRVLVPVAGNSSDARLLQYVAKIALKRQAVITLVYVVEVEQALPLDAELPTEVTHGERVLAESRESIIDSLDTKHCSIKTDLLQARSAGAAIVDEVGIQDADLIIMGAGVSKVMGKRTCGETVDYVMRNAPCEVMVLRSPMSPHLLEELEIEAE